MTEAFIKYLRSILDLHGGPEVLDELIKKRISIPKESQSIVDHPTLIVGPKRTLGVLGLINGFLASQGEKMLVAGIFDDECGCLVDFTLFNNADSE